MVPRGMENIATALAEPGERKVAFAVGAALVAFFAALLPFAAVHLPEIPAFVPAVFSAAALAQILTAILLFVQWRITGLAQLALLAIAFGTSALTGTAWLVTYPEVFAPKGLLGGAPHSTGWLFAFAQFTFGALVIAYAMLDRFPSAISRRNMRLVGGLVFGAVIAVIVVFFALGDSLPATSVGRSLTPVWTRVLIPFLIGEYAVVLAVVASTGIRTVAHVWVFVVCSCELLEIISSGSVAAARFTVGWYGGRIEHLVSASLLLYVFFVKINDLLVRLASRNRRLTERTQVDAAAIAEGEQRYRLLTNALPQLIWMADRRGNLEYVNDRWTKYAGLTLTQSQHAGWLGAVHPDDRAAVRTRWQQALEAGEPLTLEYRICERVSKRYRWFLINALPIRDSRGAITRWIATSTDIDAAKRIEERESFLALVGDRLAASIDIATTLNTVKAFAVPQLGDWCQIDLIDEDGRFVPAAVASLNAADAELLETLVGRPVEAGTQEALERIVARGEPLVIAEPHQFARRAPQSARLGRVPPHPFIVGDHRAALERGIRHRHTFLGVCERAADFGRRRGGGARLRPPRGAGARTRAPVRTRALDRRRAAARDAAGPAADPRTRQILGQLFGGQRVAARRRRFLRCLRAARRARRRHHRRRHRPWTAGRGHHGRNPPGAARRRLRAR